LYHLDVLSKINKASFLKKKKLAVHVEIVHSYLAVVVLKLNHAAKHALVFIVYN